VEALSVQEVTTIEDLATVRTLLKEYWTSIGFDLATFDFGAELDELPGRYAPPEGRLALAILSGDAVGCIALRRLDGDSCEMKRLFVRASARGSGVAVTLIQWLFSEARSQGYSRMLADTLPTMHAALRLYERFGFKRIDSYSPTPTPGAIYLEKNLRSHDSELDQQEINNQPS
jgi:GNAT superfamily N-acetyltransferase